MVRFTCEHCGNRIAVRDGLIGRRIDCPGCNRKVSVPDPHEPLELPEVDEKEQPLDKHAILQRQRIRHRNSLKDSIWFVMTLAILMLIVGGFTGLGMTLSGVSGENSVDTGFGIVILVSSIAAFFGTWFLTAAAMVIADIHEAITSSERTSEEWRQLP